MPDGRDPSDDGLGLFYFWVVGPFALLALLAVSGLVAGLFTSSRVREVSDGMRPSLIRPEAALAHRGRRSGLGSFELRGEDESLDRSRDELDGRLVQLLLRRRVMGDADHCAVESDTDASPRMTVSFTVSWVAAQSCTPTNRELTSHAACSTRGR